MNTVSVVILVFKRCSLFFSSMEASSSCSVCPPPPEIHPCNKASLSNWIKCDNNQSMKAVSWVSVLPGNGWITKVPLPICNYTIANSNKDEMTWIWKTKNKEERQGVSPLKILPWSGQAAEVGTRSEIKFAEMKGLALNSKFQNKIKWCERDTTGRITLY